MPFTWSGELKTVGETPASSNALSISLSKFVVMITLTRS